MFIRALFGLFLTLLVSSATYAAPAELLSRQQCAAQLKGFSDVREAAVWAEIKAEVKAELQKIRELGSGQRAVYLEEVSANVLKKLEVKAGSKNLATHFNLHGGMRDEYVAAGGIVAQRGDIGLAYGASNDFNQKVYFFRTADVSLTKILSTKNPNLIFFKERMGTVFIVFDLDAPVLQEYRAKKMITKDDQIFMNFDESRLRMGAKFFGVPKAAFLFPPVEVFKRTKKILDENRLTWDEETLATLRFIERYAASF
jgi:hypothetical protein